MVWRGSEGGSFIEDDGNITPRAPPEKERIKRNLSERIKVSSFLVKLFRESVVSFFISNRRRAQMCFGYCKPESAFAMYVNYK